MSSTAPKLVPKTYPLVEKTGRLQGRSALAMVALSHTPGERRVYLAMLNAAELILSAAEQSVGSLPSIPTKHLPTAFTARRVMELAGAGSLSSIRRGLQGLVAKLSVERAQDGGGSEGGRYAGFSYRVFPPDEVIARRDERGMQSFAHDGVVGDRNQSFARVIERVLDNRNLSRREAQVALCCAEGMTNAQIGLRLAVKEQTVKFHLRNVFIKFGVKRRAELISRLLM